MAMQVHPIIIGIDVAKAQVMVYRSDTRRCEPLHNAAATLAPWLRALPTHSAIAIEATNCYHLTALELAHRYGHRVYVIDGYRLSHYRQSIGGRAKTDGADAQLLARYLAAEGECLRPWSPPPPAYRPLQQLLHRRARLVEVRVALRQAFADTALTALLNPVLRQLAQVERQLEHRLLRTVQQAGLSAQLARCQAIEGIGPLTACGLLLAFLRGPFRHSDAYIAFLGLDVRIRDSGASCGRRRLTKQGDPELRRLLHNAAMAACRHPTWQPFYQRHLARGLKPTQALVALARKLARVAFALMHHQSDYQPRVGGCAAT